MLKHCNKTYTGILKIPRVKMGAKGNLCSVLLTSDYPEGLFNIYLWWSFLRILLVFFSRGRLKKMWLWQLFVSSDICPDLTIRFGFLTSQIANDLLNNKGMKNPSGSALVVSASDLLMLVFFFFCLFCRLVCFTPPSKPQHNANTANTQKYKGRCHPHKRMKQEATPDSLTEVWKPGKMLQR